MSQTRKNKSFRFGSCDPGRIFALLLIRDGLQAEQNPGGFRLPWAEPRGWKTSGFPSLDTIEITVQRQNRGKAFKL